MALAVLSGAAYVAFANVPVATISSRGPTMPWFVDEDECEYPSVERSLPDYDWGGEKPGLALCFLPLENGKIPYAVTSPPTEEILRRQREQAEDKARMARGEPPRIILNTPWFYAASQFDDRVEAYVDGSVSELKMTPELRELLRHARSGVRWRAHQKAFAEALPVTAGFCVFIWLFTAVMGWIVRGFAGVPTGQDFRSSKSD